MGKYNKWLRVPGGKVKWCNGCQKWRSELDYSEDKSTGSGYKSRCRECVAKATKRYKRRVEGRECGLKAYYHNDRMTLYQGDVRDVLAELPEESVQCVITSPPYWNLRDYGTAQWAGGDAECDHSRPMGTTRGGPASTLTGGQDTTAHKTQYGHTCGKCGAKRIDNQIGLESTPDEFVQTMVDVFRGVRRVLRNDGTLWLNLGDSYAQGGNGGGGGYAKDGLHCGPGKTMPPKKAPEGLKPKDLCMIPARVALALQADGWWLRSVIIWSKPNPMPESVHGSYFTRHRVTMEEYERLSGLRHPQRRRNQNGSGDLPILSARKSPGSQTPLSAQREGAGDSEGQGTARGRKGETPTVQPFAPGQSEQSQVRSDREGQSDADSGSIEIPQQREGQEESGRTSFVDQGITASDRTENGSQPQIFGNGKGQSQEAAGLCSTESSDSAFASCDGRGLVRDSGPSKAQVPLLWEAQDTDAGPRYPHQQGRASREREHSGSLPELQFLEGKSTDAPLLVECPGCPKCKAHNGYIRVLGSGRPTTSHEYIYLLSKSDDYFYDDRAIAEPSIRVGDVQTFGGEKARNGSIPEGDPRYRNGSEQWGRTIETSATRNKRSVWEVATAPFPGSHFATFPPALIEPCVLAGTSEKGCCPECGAPWERVVERIANYGARQDRGQPNGVMPQVDSSAWKPAAVTDKGWQPGCKHGHEPVPCTVLDPFAGACTTGLVALRNGRHFVGIDLNSDYLSMGLRRIEKDPQANQQAFDFEAPVSYGKTGTGQ